MENQGPVMERQSETKADRGAGPLVGITFLVDAIGVWIARMVICQTVCAGSDVVRALGYALAVIFSFFLLGVLGGLYQRARWALTAAFVVHVASAAAWAYVATYGQSSFTVRLAGVALFLVIYLPLTCAASRRVVAMYKPDN